MKRSLSHAMSGFFVLWIGIIMALTYPGEAFATERILAFGRGNNWIRQSTGNQLDGFTAISLSSYMSVAHMKAVTDTLHKKLHIALAGGDTLDPAPPDLTWPTSAKADSFVARFATMLAAWQTAGVDISVVSFNHEIKYSNLIAVHPDSNVFDSIQVSGKYATLLHKYKMVLNQYYQNAQFWVFSGFHDPANPQYEKGAYCIDWDSLTTGPYAPDVCLSNAYINATDLSGQKDVWSRIIRGTSEKTHGKPVTFNVSTYAYNPIDPDGDDPEHSTYYRNRYHKNWDNFREIIRHAKAVADSVNSTSVGVGYYYQHYNDWRTGPAGENYTYLVPGDYPAFTHKPTSGYFPNTYRGIPLQHQAHDYPPRFWEEGASNWQWHRTLNQWDAEFVANFFKALDYNVPGRVLSGNTTWSGNIVLIGDVVVPAYVTLTIEPGTNIYFRPYTDVYEAGLNTAKAGIIIEGGGKLSAIGTINAPIVFKSAFRADDGETPGSVDWQGIRVEEGGELVLKHCAIYDATVGVDVVPTHNEGYAPSVDIQETDFWRNYLGMKIQSGNAPPTLALKNIGIYYSAGNGLDIATNASTNEQTIELVNWTLSDNTQGMAVVSSGAAHQPVRIKNAIFSYNGWIAYAYYPTPQDVDIEFAYSDFWANTTPYQGDLYGWSVPPSGTGNVASNPVFLDRNGQDYHLDTSSPLLDAGDPTMSDPDQSVIEMGRYGGTSEHTPAPYALVYQEDFEDDQAQGWTTVAGNWTIKTVDSSKRYVMESSSQNVNRSYVQVTGWSGGYAVEARIKFHGEEGKLIYSKANQNERYRIDLMANSGNFRLMIDDTAYGYGTTINRNTWYTVKVEVRSDSVKTYLNGTLRHAVGASGAPDGYIGVGSYDGNPTSFNDHVLADDVKVWSVSGSGGGGGGIANGNFETGNLTGWTADGPWAINNTWPLNNSYQQVGLEGNYCAGTNYQESQTGNMISDTFVISQPYINFKIGGHDGQYGPDYLNKVELRRASDHALLLTTYAPGTNDLVQRSWNVSSWNNETVYIKCIDGHTGGGWAWISVDHFYQSGSAAKPTLMQVASEMTDNLPDIFSVGQNFPNPFNPETTIGYALPQALDVRLVIYNALGQEVRTLINGVQPAGFHRIVWDSRDALGRQVSSGIYLYRIVAGEFVETRKMLILK